MLRIYRAFNSDGVIKVEDKIVFGDERFDASSQITTTRSDCHHMEAKYEFVPLSALKKMIGADGGKRAIFNSMDNYGLLNPMSLAVLNDFMSKMDDLEYDAQSYRNHGLDEEAILLFVNGISLLTYEENMMFTFPIPRDTQTYRLWNRLLYNSGMYILMPNAVVGLGAKTMNDRDIGTIETYEVLQSKHIGKRLSLSKVDRKIKWY